MAIAAAPAAEVGTAVRGGCSIFKRMIDNLEKRIAGERRRLAALSAQLRKAEDQRDPDQDLIGHLKQSITTLQKQIDEDEDALADVRIDFEMFCS
jgi:hypothetical protein